MPENTEKYGPHTAEVERILNQIKTLTPEQVHQLTDAVDDEFALDMTFIPDIVLADALACATADAWYEAGGVSWKFEWYSAWDAASAAINATAAQDDITPEQYTRSVAPWVSVVGPIKGAGESSEPKLTKRRLR
ncbi:MAG: hypothetical protein ACYCU8_05990 [Ferrimicrobium acidiphilum]